MICSVFKIVHIQCVKEFGRPDNTGTTSSLPAVLLKKSRYRFEELTSARIHVEVGGVGSGRASRHNRGSRAAKSDGPPKNPPVQRR